MIDLRLGDCREILSTLPTGRVDLLLADPPYGISEQTRRSHRSRAAESYDFAPILEDDKPFDPSHLLRYKRCVLFGANHYADRLPPSGGWIVWDKLDGLKSKREWGFNDNSDCELAWTNIGNRVRLIPHRWMGMLKASERDERRVHPTQKPVALMVEIIEHYTRPGDVICDPYMGSGTTGVACVLTGRRFIGIEKDPGYFAIAESRIQRARN